MKRMEGEKRVVVKIADEGDGEAIEPARPARKGKIFTDDAREIGLDQDGIAGESERSGGSGRVEESASGCGKGRQTNFLAEAGDSRLHI